MEDQNNYSGESRRPRVSAWVLALGVLVILAAAGLRFLPILRQGSAATLTSSSLTELIDIAELSAAEFRYRGIAEAYSDEARTRLRCHICYSAVVKASIDMRDVTFSVDSERKTVTAALPAISLNVSVTDDQPMSVIPEKTGIAIREMLEVCKADAQSEAAASTELMSTAEENLRATIEGLLYPILTPQGYTLVWS